MKGSLGKQTLEQQRNRHLQKQRRTHTDTRARRDKSFLYQYGFVSLNLCFLIIITNILL